MFYNKTNATSRKREKDSQTVELAPVQNPTDLAALISPADDYLDPFVDLAEQPIDFEINRLLSDTEKLFQCFNSTLSLLNFSVAITQPYHRAHLSRDSLPLDLLFLQREETD